jgi:hypothetical protein
VAGENPPSNQINNDFAAKALQYPKNIVSLRLRLEDRLHLGTKGRCSRSEVKQIKINRNLFCISLDLHYLCPHDSLHQVITPVAMAQKRVCVCANIL